MLMIRGMINMNLKSGNSLFLILSLHNITVISFFGLLICNICDKRG